MVKVLYFARLRDSVGVGAEQVALAGGVASVEALLDMLRARGARWQEALAPNGGLRVAVNQEMAEPGTAIADGDEVAIFPPVTGG